MKVVRHGSKGIDDILKGLGELLEKRPDVEAQVEERYRKSEDGPGQPESGQARIGASKNRDSQNRDSQNRDSQNRATRKGNSAVEIGVCMASTA